jgi:P27 family predicted phage terminase small subunit
MGKRGRLPSRKLYGAKAVAAKAAAQAEHARHAPDRLLALPPGLTSGAKRRWHILAPLLLEDRRLRPDTRDALVVYCKAADQEEVLSQQLITEGAILAGPHGTYANPLHKVVQGLRSQLLRYQAVLGLDPASRARLEGAGALEDEQEQADLGGEIDRILFG